MKHQSCGPSNRNGIKSYNNKNPLFCPEKGLAAYGPEDTHRQLSSDTLNVVPCEKEDNKLPVTNIGAEGSILPLNEDDWPGWILEGNLCDDDDGMSLNLIMDNGINGNDKAVNILQMEKGQNPVEHELILSLDAALVRQKKIILVIWPVISPEVKWQHHDFLNMYKKIKETNAPNYCYRIPVHSDLVIEEWEKR